MRKEEVQAWWTREANHDSQDLLQSQTSCKERI